MKRWRGSVAGYHWETDLHSNRQRNKQMIPSDVVRHSSYCVMKQTSIDESSIDESFQNRVLDDHVIRSCSDQ